MKIKLIVSLLVLCLALSFGSVLAQTDVAGKIDNMTGNTSKVTGNITGTMICNMTGIRLES